MTLAFYTNFVSPHQVPFFQEVVNRIGVKSFRYVYTDTEPLSDEQMIAKWGTRCDFQTLSYVKQSEEACRWLQDADVLISSLRDLKLFNERCARGKKTFYFSERWFKPIPLRSGRFYLPGWLRLFSPSYFKMVYQFVLWTHRDKKAFVLAIGPWAKKDFQRMGIPRKKIIDWGYFVRTSSDNLTEGLERKNDQRDKSVLRVLWVGRLVALKRVDTLITAVGACLDKMPIELTIVGEGPEEERLIALSKRLFNMRPTAIHFLGWMTNSQVREAMVGHNLYVFTSNGEEGWGAVVSEALEEGMDVLGTFECGACPTLLSRDRLFHSGDVKALARLLEKEWKGELSPCSIDGWAAKDGANRFLEICG